MGKLRFKLADFLRSLKIDDEVICAPRSYAGIAPCLTAIQKDNQKRNYFIQTEGMIVTIRRTR